MTHSIGYFTSSQQGQQLVRRFGDGGLDKLPQIDQAGLLTALSGLILVDAQGLTLSLEESADDFVLAFDCYDVTDGFHDAIAILEGVSKDEAIGVIQFLLQ